MVFGPADPSFLVVLSDFRPIDLLILLSTRTRERRMFRVIGSAEPVCAPMGKCVRRDCVLVRIPSGMTRLNHDFSGQVAFPLPNRQGVSQLSHHDGFCRLLSSCTCHGERRFFYFYACGQSEGGMG